MPIARLVTQFTTLRIDTGDRDARTQIPLHAFIPQQLEQGAALYTQTTAGAKSRVVHVDDASAGNGFAVEAVHGFAAGECRLEQAKFGQYREPRRLQQQAGTDRPRLRRPFEQFQPMALALQQPSRRLARRAIPDDRNVHRRPVPNARGRA